MVNSMKTFKDKKEIVNLIGITQLLRLKARNYLLVLLHFLYIVNFE